MFYQSANSRQSKDVHPPPPGDGPLCFKHLNNKSLLLFLLFVGLKFKTQLRLPFRQTKKHLEQYFTYLFCLK